MRTKTLRDNKLLDTSTASANPYMFDSETMKKILSGGRFNLKDDPNFGFQRADTSY